MKWTKGAKRKREADKEDKRSKGERDREKR